MKYRWDTKSAVCFLSGHGLLHQDFTDWHEFWQELLSVSQTGLLKFWESGPAARSQHSKMWHFAVITNSKQTDVGISHCWSVNKHSCVVRVCCMEGYAFC